MKKYEEEQEVYWEVNFFDLSEEKLEDFYGNTDQEELVEQLAKKAFIKGYDTVEVIKVTKEIIRYHK